MSLRTLKDPTAYASKFATRAQNAATDYANGVAGASGQAAAAAAAADQWQQSVSSPTAKAAFVANVSAAGDAAWKAGVSAKGAGRYGPGAAAGQQKWAAKVQKYFSAMKSVNLGPRGLRGSPQNAARANAIANALHAAKTGGATS
jgi:hypothetical protein